MTPAAQFAQRPIAAAVAGIHRFPPGYHREQFEREFVGPFMPANIALKRGIKTPGAVHPSERAAFEKAPQSAQSNAMSPHHSREARTAIAGDSNGRIAYRRASDVKAKPIRWLWPGRIARGKATMLAGNPGLGKSQTAGADMAARVSTGGGWPDGGRCERGNVVILSAEDDAEDTIRPRLEAAGADLSRVFILDAVVDGYRADGSEAHRAFNLKGDLFRLGRMLEEIDGAALIVIDPITAYLGETDSHKNAEIRARLSCEYRT